jgi:uncharacterized OB-fold protein
MSERFQAALKKRRLELPRCSACGEWHWPPHERCPHCLEDRLEWVAVAGTGVIYSYAVYHQVYHAAFEGRVPYNVAIIELDEGPRLVSSVTGPNELVAIGKRVKVQFEDVDEQRALHRFALVAGG